MDSGKKEKPKIKIKWKNILYLFCGIMLIVYMGYNFYKSNYSPVSTQTVEMSDVEETISLDAFIIRDEAYIKSNTKNTVVPLVTDGDRVASGDVIAFECSDEASAAQYTELKKTRSELARYKQLQSKDELNGIDMAKLNAEITSIYNEMLDVADSGEYDKLSSKVESLEDKYAVKQNITDNSLNLSEKITELTATEEKLSKAVDSSNSHEVTAPQSGYYISTADGYENSFDYKKAENLTVKDAEKIFSSKAEEPGDNFGKIVKSYKWYLVTVMDVKDAVGFGEGDTMQINIPSCAYNDVDVKVENRSSEANGKICIVFSCNLMNETYAHLRSEKIELITNKAEGYKIPQSSIHVVDGKKGVYVLRGSTIKFRTINVIYENKSYVLAKAEISNDTTQIKLYDKVIIKGRNLYDGKSIS